MILKLFAQLPALAADVANGLFAVLLASALTSTEPLWWHFLIGVPLAFLPDIDAIPELVKRGRVAASAEHPYDHRTLLHYPIITLILGLIVVFLFGYWGLVVLIAVVLHLFNDLYGTGWGLPVLWPISKSHVKVFARRVNQSKHHLNQTGTWDQLSQSERKPRLVVVWNSQELPRYIKEYGYEAWLHETYYRCNWISFIEYNLLIIAIVLTVLTLV